MFENNRKSVFGVIRKALVSVLLLMLCLCICACSEIIYAEVGLYNERKFIVLAEAFEENGMDAWQPDYTVEEYEKVKDIFSKDDALLYYDKLGEDECNKIMMALGYEDYDDFLISKGYVDKNGKADRDRYRMDTHKRITKEMTGGK